MQTDIEQRAAEALPAYDDSAAFWRAVLAQKGQRDAYGREILICGAGAAGFILCTRDYAEFALRRSAKREAGERAAATRRLRKLAEGARVRAIQDAALARAEGRA